MLRLIGAIVVVLLILAPLLTRIGLVDQYGLLHGFVDLEARALEELVGAIDRLFGR